MIYALVSHKGGVGKSTLATNIAFGLSKESDVLLIDTDEQGSSLDWINTREEETDLTVIGFPKKKIHKEIEKISRAYEHVVIDTPSHSSSLVRGAILASDRVLIPVQPSPYDIWAVAETVNLIEEIWDLKEVPAVFIINRKIVNTVIGKDASQILNDYGLPVLNTHICQRVIFPESASSGRSVLEFSSEARLEVDDLIEEIKSL
ncbi:MAG: AAA family ATPase [SAR324 cluster bacterium]|nr:AAA family ATPase [SAR324 cluster bacterium]